MAIGHSNVELFVGIYNLLYNLFVVNTYHRLNTVRRKELYKALKKNVKMHTTFCFKLRNPK